MRSEHRMGAQHQRKLIYWKSSLMVLSFPLVLACNSDITTGDPAAILHHEETLNWKLWTWVREQSLACSGCHANHRLPTPGHLLYEIDKLSCLSHVIGLQELLLLLNS